MKITGARVIVASPGRNYVTLKIETDGGTYGVGDATLNGRELAVASYLSEHVVPLLIGREAMNIEDTWQLLYRGAYWRRGPVTMAAIAAVDMALWDIKGKELGTPVWNLLGGRCRDGVLAYSHASARTFDEVVRQVEALLRGRLPCRPGRMPGPGDRGNVRRPARRRRPVTAPAFPSRRTTGPARRTCVSSRNCSPPSATPLGPEPMLLHDAHHRLTPSQAGWLGQRLEDFQLFWLEDAVPAEWQDGYRILRHHTTTPLAVGEVFNTIFDCDRLVRNDWVDYIRTSALHAGRDHAPAQDRRLRRHRTT